MSRFTPEPPSLLPLQVLTKPAQKARWLQKVRRPREQHQEAPPKEAQTRRRGPQPREGPAYTPTSPAISPINSVLDIPIHNLSLRNPGNLGKMSMLSEESTHPSTQSRHGLKVSTTEAAGPPNNPIRKRHVKNEYKDAPEERVNRQRAKGRADNRRRRGG